MSEIQVVLVENDEKTRVSMREALRQQEGIQIYSEATNATTGLVLLESVGGDVALIDLMLPDMDAVELMEEFRQIQEDAINPEMRFMILCPPDHKQASLAAFATGACSYCLKTAPIEQIAEGVRLTHPDGFYLDPAIAAILLPLVKDAQPEAILTEAELNILELIASGSNYEAIALKLNISVETMRSHLGNILNRLYVSELIQNALKGMRAGK